MRIRDEDCDVEMLQESDFQETETLDPTIFGRQTKVHVLYAIQLAKISVVCEFASKTSSRCRGT